MNALHPSILLFAGAALALILKGSWRKAAVIAAPVLALAAVWGLGAESSWPHSVAGYGLELLRADKLSRLFAIVFCLVSFIGVLYSLHLKNGGEQTASLALAGGSLGVVFAGDWLTLFVFWELMTVASLWLIWLAGTTAAKKAGMRYLMLHVLGGGTLMAGILLHLAVGGDPRIGVLSGGEMGAASWLILIGVCLNAAVPPLHPWLTDAYPECSITGSVVQSAFTTKTAVYVLLRVFPGAEPLALLGTVMAVYGVIFAVLENDIRRLLAYHIVSQVGFMVAGVGLGSALALDGAAAHAFCHILYKALLFMGAGAVIHATGRGKLTELGGLIRTMPGTFLLFMVGALSISGLPPLNGFISKTMTISAAESLRPHLALGLELASVGTFLSIGLKLAYFAFFDGPGRAEDVDARRLGPRRLPNRPLPTGMTIAMGTAAALCAALGLFPELLYRLLPMGAAYHPYTMGHVLSSLQLHLGTAIGFWLALGILQVKPKISLDVDWLYRKPFAALMGGIVGGARGAGRLASETALRLAQAAAALPEGFDPDQRRLPLGANLFWISMFFCAIAAWILRA